MKLNADMNNAVCNGFSLFEVLIALAVISVGLLGLANLQGQSMSSSYNAYLRTQATTLAQNVVDRMRANREYAMDSSNNYQTQFNSPPPTTDVDCSSSICGRASMALSDVREWKCNLGKHVNDSACEGLASHATLPSGEGSVSAPNASTGQTAVTVRWTDTEGEQHQVRMFTSL